jgi:hypothetical protein
VFDKSKKEAWAVFQEEVCYIHNTIPTLLPHKDLLDHDNEDNASPSITLEDLVKLMFGEKSEFATIFSNELSTDILTFAKFMANLCMQMSYKETPSSLYNQYSLLQNVLVSTSTLVSASALALLSASAPAPAPAPAPA